MTDNEELTEIVRKKYGVPPFGKKEKKEFGGSTAGFCARAVQYKKTYDLKTDANFNMVCGSVFHNFVLPQLVKGSKVGNAHKPSRPWAFWEKKFWTQCVNKPIYEREEKYDFAEKGFKLQIHVDCDLPAADRIIEFKTTGWSDAMKPTDYLCKVYCMQANAYATLLERSKWEIWVFHKSFQSIDPEENNVVTVLEGETNKELFIDFLLHMKQIASFIGQDDVLLAGPEASWECKNCSFPVICEHYLEDFEILYNAAESELTSKKAICEFVDEMVYKIANKQGLISYSWTDKVYHKTKKFDRKMKEASEIADKKRD